jgi:P-type Mg2+ transporter
VRNHHDKIQGLNPAEARERLVQFGPNELISARRLTGLWQLLFFFANPLVIILLIASVISAFVGEPVDAAIIALVVLLSVALNFIQTSRSQRAAERLRAQVAPTASALRDRMWTEIPRREIVPGDVIRLSAGDLVPADARLIESRDLHVNQAALTGESLPVEKDAMPSANVDYPRDMVFLGSSIVSGTAIAGVTATGADTAFGDIAARLAERPPETEFERGTRQFGLRTAGSPLRSRPSRPLTITTLLVAGAGMTLPFTPLGKPLGFTPLPLSYFAFLVAATLTYLLLVELVKRRLMRWM